MFGHFQKTLQQSTGFTLAELLISLAILGVIATFSIPKILISQQKARYNTGAKELAGTVSTLFVNAYNANGGETWIDSDPIILEQEIIPNLNYVSTLGAGEVMTLPPGGPDAVYAGAHDCQWVRCFQLYSGGVLWYTPLGVKWDGQYMQTFLYDPDGSGPEESVPFVIMASKESWLSDPNGYKYPPGRIMTFKELGHINWGPYGTDNPSWFSWN